MRSRWLTLGLLAGLLTGGGLVRADAVPPAGLAGFVALSPSRVMDTRVGLGVPKGQLAAGATARLDLAGLVPDDATAIVLNVTETGATTAGYLTVYPDGDSRPEVSNLNWADGGAHPNLVTVRLGGHAVLFYNAFGSVDVLADLAGYYQATRPVPGGVSAVGFSIGGGPQTILVNALALEGSAQLVAQQAVAPGKYLVTGSVQVSAGDVSTDLGCYLGSGSGAMTFSAPGISRVNTAHGAIVQVVDAVVSTAAPIGQILLSCKAITTDAATAHSVHVEFAQLNIQQVGSLNGA